MVTSPGRVGARPSARHGAAATSRGGRTAFRRGRGGRRRTSPSGWPGRRGGPRAARRRSAGRRRAVEGAGRTVGVPCSTTRVQAPAVATSTQIGGGEEGGGRGEPPDPSAKAPGTRCPKAVPGSGAASLPSTRVRTSTLIRRLPSPAGTEAVPVPVHHRLEGGGQEGSGGGAGPGPPEQRADPPGHLGRLFVQVARVKRSAPSEKAGWVRAGDLANTQAPATPSVASSWGSPRHGSGAGRRPTPRHRSAPPPRAARPCWGGTAPPRPRPWPAARRGPRAVPARPCSGWACGGGTAPSRPAGVPGRRTPRGSRRPGRPSGSRRRARRRTSRRPRPTGRPGMPGWTPSAGRAPSRAGGTARACGRAGATRGRAGRHRGGRAPRQREEPQLGPVHPLPFGSTTCPMLPTAPRRCTRRRCG